MAHLSLFVLRAASPSDMDALIELCAEHAATGIEKRLFRWEETNEGRRKRAALLARTMLS